MLLVDRVQLALFLLAHDLGSFFLVDIGLGDVVGERRGIGGGRHLVRVIRVEAGRDALLLGEPGELVVVQAVYLPAVYPAVPVKLLGELLILLRQRASC